MLTDPLQLLYNEKMPDPSLIDKIVFGERHVAVLQNNYLLGTFTCLGIQIFAEKEILPQPDFANISHRVLLIAYYNAYYNYANVSEGIAI